MENSKNKILIVDDIDSSRSLLAQMLLREGYEVETACSGDEALRLCSHKEIDLCILDIDMPQMNGFELAQQLRNNWATEHIYFIFVTGSYNNREHLLKAYKIGAVDYIAKPLDREILVSKVEMYFFSINKEKQLRNQNKHLLLELELQKDQTVKVNELEIDTSLIEQDCLLPFNLNVNINCNTDKCSYSEQKPIKFVKQQDKSSLLSLMNHELRTPLHSVIGFSQLLLLDQTPQSLLNTEQEVSVRQIFDSGHRLLGLVDELLDLSQIESGDMVIPTETVNPDNVLDELLPAMKSHTAIIIKQHVTTFVFANYQRLKQVFIHLINNVIEQCKEPAIVFVDFYKTTDNFLRVIISETVNGYNFQQMKPMTISSCPGFHNIAHKGVGTSLNIVQCLVLKMSGRLGVANQEEGMNTFWVDLPIDGVA